MQVRVMPLPPGTGGAAVTVSGAFPHRQEGGRLPVVCGARACAGPADSPGRFGVIDVAGVGKGTVSVVLPVRAVARACASSVVPRMKFTIGRPKPRFAKPLPVIVKLAGGVARSIELGVMPLTPGTWGESATVLQARPNSLKRRLLPDCCQTWASTGSANSPGRFGVIDVAGVGKGTVSVVPVIFFNDTATTEIFPLSLHDALPI